MELLGLSPVLRRVADLDDVLRASMEAEPTTTPVGLLTLDGPPAAGDGWRSLSVERGVSRGSIDAVREFVLGFGVLRHVGLGVLADTPRAEVGTTVVQRMPRRGPAVLAPCQVVEVVDTADEVGFTYAALPGHPFTGEEVFHVRREDDGTIRCRVASLSRARATAARIATPVTRQLQTVIASRYLDGMATVAAGRVGDEQP